MTLFRCLLTISWIVFVLFKSGSAAEAAGYVLSADETGTSGPRTEIVYAVTAARMKSLADEAIQQRRIVTDVQIRLVDRDLVFDVTLNDDSENQPWLILLNMSEAAHADACRRYEADGFRRLVDRSIDVNRQRYYSVVWVKNAPGSNGPLLQMPHGPRPESGTGDERLESLSRMVQSFLQEQNIPGAALAVAKDGRVIYERGFGYSRLQPLEPMRADARMRIASVSKSITAVAVLKLVEQGRLDLDAGVLKVLEPLGYVKQAVPIDQRWQKMTVRHLLQHTAGWDRDAKSDPMFQVVRITQEMKLSRPAGFREIIRHQLQLPLDFEPGQKFVYSNFGYCLLGRVIEVVSGQSYAEFVQEQILKPASMQRTRLGRTRLKSRISDEAYYYTQHLSQHPAFWEVNRNTRSKKIPDVVPAPYGRWDLEVMDSHSGWTSTSGDLLRFLSQLQDGEQPLLRCEIRELMLARPETSGLSPSVDWYGCGWNVRSDAAGMPVAIWHNGGLDGTSALLVHRFDGYSWAILFNVDFTASEVRCYEAVDRLIHQAIDSVEFD